MALSAPVRPVGRARRAFLDFLDWFVPQRFYADRADHAVARFFAFTHIFGPLLAMPAAVALLTITPAGDYRQWIIAAAVMSFLILPFVLRATANLAVVALISIETLTATALYAAYNYGGLSSPFLPWAIVALFLGFFYFSTQPLLVVALFAANISVFVASYVVGGFPEIIPAHELAGVGWVSIAAATIYMTWIAVYYGVMVSLRSDLQREVERHRATAERLRIARDHAEQANEDKSQFLARMSHELRTPLNAIIGYSEMMLEDTDPESEPAADLARIGAAGKHLLSLVADVLEPSAIDGRDLTLAVERVDLLDILKDVTATARPLVAARKNRLVLDCQPAPGEIVTDPTKLRQVLLNLLSNAAKFTSEGDVRLAVTRDGIAGEWLEFRVEDTGIGMSAEEVGNLFTDFGQASASTASRYGGTGLGLALSQRLCTLMGGGITVTSRVGRGSTFVVRVPAVLSQDSEPAVDDDVHPQSPTLPARASAYEVTR